jgi:hypothetical protein
MLEVQAFVFAPNTTTMVLAILAAVLSFVITLLVYLCDQPVLDPHFEGHTRLDRRGNPPNAIR